MNIPILILAIFCLIGVSVIVVAAIKQVNRANDRTERAEAEQARLHNEIALLGDRVSRAEEKVKRPAQPNEFELAGLKALAHLAENAIMDEVKLNAATLLTFGPSPVYSKLADPLANRLRGL